MVTFDRYQVMDQPGRELGNLQIPTREPKWHEFSTQRRPRSPAAGPAATGALDVQLRSPKEMGGEGGGTNPEQLFAVGYAACFESALGVVGRRERAEVGDVSIDSRVSLLPTKERGFTLAVELHVTLPQVQDPEQAARIVAAAHRVCPYSNATRGNIDVTLRVNGQDIG
jgi:osmotically inducible protein OsmC